MTMAKFFKAFLPSVTIIVILLLTLRQTPLELPTEKEPDHLHYPWNPNTEFNYSIRIDRPGLPPAPILPPGYRTETLTRLGTDLDFDLHTCPPGSIMTNVKSASIPPVHNDCPTLFIAGARKGGSTSMIKYISKHPDFKGAKLNGPSVGEVFFFMNKFYKPGSEKQWKWYLSNFPKGVVTGESSVGYMVHCLVPERIFRACGRQAKIVMLLRNPVDRFVSNFLMRVRVTGYGNRITKSTPITSVIHEEVHSFLNRTDTATTNTLTEDWSKLRCAFQQSENMIYEGTYYIHVLNWMCNFPAENILLINSEEMYKNTSTILKQIFQFLGLKPMPDRERNEIGKVIYNGGKHDNVPPHQQLSQSDKQTLQKALEPYNRAFLRLLHWENQKVEWM